MAVGIRTFPRQATRNGPTFPPAPRTRSTPKPYEGVTELTHLLEIDARDFLDHAEELGALDEVALEAFALEHDLDQEDLAILRAELEARGVEVLEAGIAVDDDQPEADDGREKPVARATHEVSGTTDS